MALNFPNNPIIGQQYTDPNGNVWEFDGTVWNIVISIEPGATGATGATGIGIDGATGATGTPGATGPAGSTGASGFSGYSGTSGFSGYSGTSGFSGYSGAVGSTGPVAGSNTQIIFNDANTANGSANLTFNKSTNLLTVTGAATITGNISVANVTSSSYAIVSVGTAISAAGTVQANATSLTKEFNVVSTVASGAGVKLPTAIAGMRITIVNTSANAVLVYPDTNGIINSQSANTSYSQPAGARLDYISTTTQWYTLNATYG